MTPLKGWGEGDKKLNGFAKVFMEALSTLGLMTETWRQCFSSGRKAMRSSKYPTKGTIFAFPCLCPPARKGR